MTAVRLPVLRSIARVSRGAQAAAMCIPEADVQTIELAPLDALDFGTVAAYVRALGGTVVVVATLAHGTSYELK